MANAGKAHMSPDGQGKGSGSGAATEIDKDKMGDNMVLSNRDKAQHTGERGLDNKQIEADQYQDDDSNKLRED